MLEHSVISCGDLVTFIYTCLSTMCQDAPSPSLATVTIGKDLQEDGMRFKQVAFLLL